VAGKERKARIASLCQQFADLVELWWNASSFSCFLVCACTLPFLLSYTLSLLWELQTQTSQPLGVAILPELLPFQPMDISPKDAATASPAPSLNEAQSSSLLTSLAAAATGSGTSSGVVLVSSGAAEQLSGGPEANAAEAARREAAAQAAADAAAGVVSSPSSSSSQEGVEEKGAGGFLKGGFSTAAKTSTSTSSSSIPKVASGQVRKAIAVLGVVSVPPGQV